MIQARQHADRLLVEKENRLLHIFRRLRIAKKDAAFNILEPIAELTLAKEEVAIIRESRLTIESELIRLITKTILTLEHLSKMPNQQGEFSALTYKIQKAARIAQQLGFDDLWLTTQKAVAKCIRQFEKTIMNEEE